MRRFGVSLEQLAHRLTTLQRVGQRGLPFFMARIDRAGQFSKRFTGASGATLLEGSGTCPLWIPHSAFERAGQYCRQVVHLPEAGAAPANWLTIARTVEGSFFDGVTRFAIVLGLEGRLAGNLALSRGLSLDQDDAQIIGPGCAACHIQDCRQRSLPPTGAKLYFEQLSHTDAPFQFG